LHRSNFIKSLLLLIAGFALAYLAFTVIDKDNDDDNDRSSNRSIGFSVNPFSTESEDYTDVQRIELLESSVVQLKQQLMQLEQQLEAANEAIAVLNQADPSASVATVKKDDRGRFMVSAMNQRLYNLDNLIRGGIDPLQAEDIIRRKNSIDLKRLELQDRARRENYLNTQRYYDELEEISRLDVSLREELGDERYDQYLFDSKQNNRVRIASVMLGSVAEEAGILSGDVVLSYDNQQMFTWDELKDATASGELGEYVSISINRDGEIFSFSVPRGPLGVQLGATRLQP
jgi:C-terminal processing protease CtpA/Prc